METPAINEAEQPRAFGDTPEVEPETNKDGQVIATQEEQENYDMVVARAIKIIYGEGQDDILKLMGSSETPAEGMGRATANIIRVVQQSAKENKREISTETLMYAGMEIIQELSEHGKEQGIFTYDDDDDELTQIQDAGMYATQFYGKAQEANGEIPQEERQKAGNMMQAGIEKEQGGETEPEPVDNVGIINNISGGQDGAY